LDLAKQQQEQSTKTLGIVEPGLKTAEDYYASLASGDPTKIMSAIGPAVSQIGSQTNQAKTQIKQSTPRGGAQDLALAEADISKAGQVGNLETQSYTGAFPALASLFQGGAGISVSQIANAIASAQGASQTTAAVGQEQASAKASTMGMFGSMAGAAGTAFEGACWLARAIYGEKDLRPILISEMWWRKWARESFFARVMLALYLVFGEPLSVVAKRFEWVRSLFKLVFDRVLEKAIQDAKTFQDGIDRRAA
jgi:hypothetical protein